MKCFFQELLKNTGSVSSMRVMTLMCCITAIGIAFVGISKPVIDYSGLSLLVSTFLGAAMGGKIVQKRIETTKPE